MTRLALLLALAVPVALAQAPRGPAAGRDVPTERYHEGARAFVDGEMGRARAAVEAGLRAAPDDARLQALRALIEQQEEQDQQQGGQDQDRQDGGEDRDGGPQEQDGEDSPGDRRPPPPDDPEAEQDQTRTQPQDPGDSDSEETQGGRQTGAGGAPEAEAEAPQGQMSRAQADRILDAVGGEERLLLEELQRRPTRGRRSEKDW